MPIFLTDSFATYASKTGLFSTRSPPRPKGCDSFAVQNLDGNSIKNEQMKKKFLSKKASIDDLLF